MYTTNSKVSLFTIAQFEYKYFFLSDMLLNLSIFYWYWLPKNFFKIESLIYTLKLILSYKSFADKECNT